MRSRVVRRHDDRLVDFGYRNCGDQRVWLQRLYSAQHHVYASVAQHRQSDGILVGDEVKTQCRKPLAQLREKRCGIAQVKQRACANP
ncbi:hypothetical protein D3C72_2319240 [compost metagenome]